MARPDWDDWFLGQLPAISRRATCDRGRSACLVSRHNYQLVAGYAGSLPGFPHCDDVGHELVMIDGREHCVRTVHAEQNAILNAAQVGAALGKSTFYCTMEPCKTCAKMMVCVGVKRVVALARYHAAEETREIFRTAGIELDVRLDKELY
jgi:dCMP deaminase